MERANEPTRNRKSHLDNISVNALCMLAPMPRACAFSFVLLLMLMSVLMLVCEVMLTDVYGRCLARVLPRSLSCPWSVLMLVYVWHVD